MQIQHILGYFWAIFGLYQPPGPPLLDLGPPFYISWIRPCFDMSVRRLKGMVALILVNCRHTGCIDMLEPIMNSLI